MALFGNNPQYSNRTTFRWGGLLMAALVAGFSICKYYSSSELNEITGEKQHIGNITKEQEIILGLQSAPAMAQEFGGLYPDEKAQAYIKQVGRRIEQNSAVQTSAYQYDFHMLADPNVVNAFALPGGQVFITKALFSKLKNEDQLAGILGHEISHVVARHGSQQMAKQELIQGVTGAAVIAAGDYSSAQGIQMIANLIGMKYGRDHEIEADELGVRFMIEAGYDANSLIDVMHILEEASGGQRQPEYLSTHPNPGNRIEKIKLAIEKYSKNAPEGLQQKPGNKPEIKLKDPNLKLN